MNAHRPDTDRRSHGIRRGLRVAVWAFALLGVQAQAKVSIGNIGDFDFGTWSPGSGAAVIEQDVCVESWAGRTRDWSATLTDLSGASSGSSFRIASVSGAGTLGLGVRLRQLPGGGVDTLEPGVSTPEDLAGADQGCPDGPNARLEVRIEAAEFEAATAGSFEGSFEFEASGRGQDAATFSIRAQVPDLVRISGLNDIDLGSFPGSGDMVGEDGLCVYRNDPSARYDLSARGEGAAMDFTMDQGGTTLPFEVEYDDGGGFAPLQPGQDISAEGADTSAVGCGGTANARVRVRVREGDLLAADTGSYAGTLTLTVAPI